MILSLCKLLRLFVGWFDLFILTCLLYIISFIPNKFIKQLFPQLFYYWCQIFVRAIGVNLSVHEKNRHALPKQYIVIGNHPSAFEDIGMPALFKAHYLAKYEVQHWWWVGRISKAAGTLFFKREDKADRKAAFNTLLDVLKKGESIGLYPEGGCKGRRIHLPFHHNVFELSIQSGVPILPVFLHYEAQESFEWQGQTLVQKIWEMTRARNRTANYYIYDAIQPAQFSDKTAFCNHVQDLYLAWQRQYLD